MTNAIRLLLLLTALGPAALLPAAPSPAGAPSSAQTGGGAKRRASEATSVWKATSPSGQVLLLGGSIHRLDSTDYPLPAAFNRAFELSQGLAFEVAPDSTKNAPERWNKAGLYPQGDSLRQHVDPRTYQFVTQVFARLRVPEAQIARCRPWYLVYLLSSGGPGGPGVESYFMSRAQANKRRIESLETVDEAMRAFTGLSDRQSEALLLVTFIQAKAGNRGNMSAMKRAWRTGDPDFVARTLRDDYRDFPAMADRLLGARNRAWMPRLEAFAASGKTYFVLAGAAHLGGSDGLLALLRARGYRIEQW